MNETKVYVAVRVLYKADGVMIPRSITWEDNEYKIDKVTQILQASSMRSGDLGDRYTIYVNGRQSYLYFERSSNLTGSYIGRWAVQRRGA